MKKIEIFDSTLRDGAQGEGISFSLEDKLSIVRCLDELGIDFIEAGSPSFNPKNLEFFNAVKNIKLEHSILVAFGSTRRKGISAKDDKGIKALIESGAKVACIFGKSSELHVKEILGTTEEENLEMIADSIITLKENGMRVFFDAEHFFDGYKLNPQFTLNTLKAAADAGAECLSLCDTNGGCFPDEIYDITKKVTETFSNIKIGIHCHNDSGMAISNSIMAVKAGAVQVQGTYLGYGERCGNANLSSIIPNLQLKLGYSCIPDYCMSNLTHAAHAISEISNIRLNATTPYVGKSAFAHKAGTHTDGVFKNSTSFEHINPQTVGNERRFLMSDQAGRTAVLRKISKIIPDILKDSPEIELILNTLKQKELEGYQFEGADGSFELLVRKQLGMYLPFFELVSYKILDEEPSETSHSATATIKIRVGSRLQITAAEGDGPVNALDLALREALGIFYPTLASVKLIDYKVRVMDSGNATAAKVRVLITSSDDKTTWTTVGAGEDVIKASWIALVDSLEYKLIKSR